MHSVHSPLLRAIVAELDAAPALTSQALGSTLRHPVNIDDVAPWIHFDPDNYVRNLITRTDRWELRLLCWRPGQSSSLHGHGGAACAFRVLRGSATESVLGQRDRTWVPGNVVDESSPRLVHEVGNRAADALLTLHAYSPPLPVDAPSPRRGREVIIVGGGFSGVAVAYHLLLRAAKDLRITLVERGPWLGRGVAYGVDSRVFRLNVPASKMSIDPGAPVDFVEWAGAQREPHAFLSRALYGDYVVAKLAQAIAASPGKMRVIRGDVLSVDATSVHLGDGQALDAPTVVLATGLEPRMVPQHLAEDARVIDAWDECAIATLPPSGHILVLGSGLTAIDVIGLLHARRYAGRITILSRRGLLPAAHLEPFVPAPPLPADIAASAPRSLASLVRWTRRLVDDAVARGEPWQLAIDALRPHVTGLWQSLSPEDRGRFVRTLRPYWDVLRHRAPADALGVVDAWRASGRLETLPGRIVACVGRDRGLDVTIRVRGGSVRHERFDAVVRCIGPALERAESDNPLMSSLFTARLAQPDPTGLGLVTDARGRVVRSDGGASERLFAVGALRRPAEWESTAVPDIARQAAALARHLLA
jgi:uncharacterized NAD(P)/FAD-binding protein YdhS